MNRHASILCAAGLLVATLPARAAPESAALRGPAPSLGLVLEPADLPLLPERAGERAASPFLVRLTARWSEVERERGVHDWSAVAPLLARVVEAGLEPVLCLTGANPLYLAPGSLPSPLEGDSLEGWTAFVRSAARSFRGQVRAYEIWDGPDREGFEPAAYAFLVKATSLALRAEAAAAGAEVVVVQGAIDSGSLEWQRAVWEGEVAPYIDVLAVGLASGGPEGGIEIAVSTIFAEALQHPPAPALWAYLDPGSAPARRSGLAGAVEALAASAQAALVRPVGEGEAASESVRWTLGLHALLAEGFAPAPRGSLSLQDADGRPLAGARIAGRFLGERDLASLVVCDLGEAEPGEGGEARLVVAGRGLRETRFVDPAAGTRVRAAATAAPAGTALRLPWRRLPVAALFREPAAASGLELPTEELEVRRGRSLTADEIIARYRQVQKQQDDRLERYLARGRVEFHFRIAGTGPTIDIAIESNYFWERGGELEWEQTDYYVNGSRVKWKKIPELPLIQPEKVITLPLDLTLDRTYVYRLEGEEEVEGRPAWVLGFEPAAPDPGRSLYGGRVWIDRETFVRLRAALVQTGLEAPVLANEERDGYAPFTGPDGLTYWLLSRVEGQQVWTAAGRNLLVQRELLFRDVEINPPRQDFEARRSRAHASENQMLRDTAEGFRYLERRDDGTRVVKTTVDPSQIFAAGGVFKDESIDNVVPLAGVNYFNYDLFGKGIQTNLFFAGVFGFFNATKADLAGRLDVAAEATLSALEGDDKVWVGDEEIVEERVEGRGQNFSARLGVPLGSFFKVTLDGDVDFVRYSQDDEATKAREEQGLDFVLPPDHRVLTGTVQVEYNRRGYTVSAQGSWSRRSEWEAWGLTDAATGEFLDPEFDPSHRAFTTWRATAFKEWFLPRFQKARGEIAYLSGRDLDRFSRFSFSFFGDTSLAGFAGTGVRFDRGAIARARYSFNLFEVVQFSGLVETAQVEQEGSGQGTQSFTGAGVSGNFVGPWKTVIAFSYGRAVRSDIADLEGSQEFLLSVFKLF